MDRQLQPTQFTPASARGDAETTVLHSILIVCFHSLHELAPCLNVLRAGPLRSNFELIVVNNSQSDSAEVSDLCTAEVVSLLQSGVNLGYGAACNLGVAQARGSDVLFMTPDVRISSASTQLLTDLSDDNAGLVAISPLQAIFRVMRENFMVQKWIYTLAIVALVIVASSNAASALIMKAIFDVLSNDLLAYSAPLVASLVVIILTGKGLSGYIQQVALAKAGNRVVADIQRKIYHNLMLKEIA